MLKVLVNVSSILFVILEIQLQRRNMVGKQEHCEYCLKDGNQKCVPCGVKWPAPAYSA